MIGPIITDLLDLYGSAIIVLVGLINVATLILLGASVSAALDGRRRSRRADSRPVVRSGSGVPISVIIPVRHDSLTIMTSLHSLLGRAHDAIEVVAVNDGGTDDTLETLIREFSLRRTPRLYVPHLRTRPVRGIYVSTREEWKRLIVVDKEDGGKADALNAGVNISRHPLLCAMDAGSVLENDALVNAARPFLEDDRTVAATGIVRVANGCAIEQGGITEVRPPRAVFPLLQSAEYLRAFLAGPVGWNTITGPLITMRAFGLFRKEVVIACGGYRHNTVDEGVELIVRIHRFMQERRIPYRVAFVPDTVCWTEVPEAARELGHQRSRWHRGLLDSLILHGRMLFNPRFGHVGLLAMPAAVLELLAPVAELSGYLVLPLAAGVGLLGVDLLLAFLVVSVVLGGLVSVAAVLLDELSGHRRRNPRDLVRLVGVALVGHFWYRQLTLWWSVKGIIDSVRSGEVWAAMQPTEFGGARKPS